MTSGRLGMGPLALGAELRKMIIVDIFNLAETQGE